ncbi:MAG: type II toxin-antitoxin system prevent-host-death family antitoxin [Bifidobacteriaceae bacterium]|jgi:prevent-host-death family protein|nr:type II toxin-antitoxin system prevent-host-death family antitoxin [Bifidobacteriaceae bacterium]
MSIVAIRQVPNAVGLRELRANLSGYLDQVKAGRTYTLTEHGRPVARLVPVAGTSAYERLVAAGVILTAAKAASAPEPPIAIRGTVSDLVEQQRR